MQVNIFQERIDVIIQFDAHMWGKTESNNARSSSCDTQICWGKIAVDEIYRSSSSSGRAVS